MRSQGHEGDAIYGAAEGPQRVGPGTRGGVPRPDSGSSPSLAQGGRGVRRADPPGGERVGRGEGGGGDGLGPEGELGRLGYAEGKGRGRNRSSRVGPRGRKREGKERKGGRERERSGPGQKRQERKGTKGKGIEAKEKQANSFKFKLWNLNSTER
jgi:hypothetical protein